MDRINILQAEVSYKNIYDGQPTYREALDLFESLGFEQAGLFANVRDYNWSFIEADCVMVKGSQP